MYESSLERLWAILKHLFHFSNNLAFVDIYGRQLFPLLEPETLILEQNLMQESDLRPNNLCLAGTTWLFSRVNKSLLANDVLLRYLLLWWVPWLPDPRATSLIQQQLGWKHFFYLADVAEKKRYMFSFLEQFIVVLWLIFGVWII